MLNSWTHTVGLFALGTENTQFQVCKKTDLNEEVHRCFFLDWISKMLSIKAEFIQYPRDEHEYWFVVDGYAAVGLPGCVGSVDCVHTGWDKCPTHHMNLHKGKENYPSVAYEIICTSCKDLFCVMWASRIKERQAHCKNRRCTDAAIMNLLYPHN